MHARFFLDHLDQLMPSVDALLCVAEEKLSLREFCNLNDHGLYVLNYTIGLVEQAESRREECCWTVGELVEWLGTS